MKHIILALSSPSIAMREATLGAINYLNAQRNLDVQVLQDARRIDINDLKAEGDRKIDGIISGFDSDNETFRALVRSGIPLALVNTPPNWVRSPSDRFALLHIDEIATGRQAARFFKTRGSFRSYAFVSGGQHNYWTTYRRRGFGLELAASGITARSYRPSRGPMDKWLNELPKPAAILAVNDFYARNILEACRRLGLKVPDQVAVLGVDNDELLCLTSRPTLSSIHPNHTELGRRAAVELKKLMRGKMPPEKPVMIPPLEIVERDSTRKVPPAGALIQRALGYIDLHFADGISVHDVARELGVSESLLRLRFRTINGSSVKALVLQRQMDLAKRLLRQSGEPVGTIAARCGFRSIYRFSAQFKKILGLSPLDYRKSCKSGSPT